MKSEKKRGKLHLQVSSHFHKRRAKTPKAVEERRHQEVVHSVHREEKEVAQ